ncbi:MAG: spermidine synthase [Fimbriimonadales bacterium]
MRILFTVTLFLSSALLFLIEPMIAKMILPRFGGSPSVWNTSLLFFQIALLAGYGYAHIATKWLGPRVQALTHILVLLLPLLVLPFAVPGGVESGSANPAPLVLFVLMITVGLPFLVVSAGAPLLQRWFAATDDPHAHDPYFLYSASNLGSMLALLAYPFVIEPRFRLSEQSRLWTYGFGGLVLLMAICAFALWSHRGRGEPIHEAPPTMPPEVEEGDAPADNDEIDLKRRVLWVALSFCPSSLLMGVTTYLTSNIAPIPLLWVVPLALYLLTFIVAFARKQVISSKLIGRILPILIVPLAFTMILESSQQSIIFYLILLHLIVFFATSLMCHTELAGSRPTPVRLTEFFFYVSLGGVLGGVFNALIAPTVFNSFFEYPLVLAAACAFRPKAAGWKIARLDWVYPFGVAIVAMATALLLKPMDLESHVKSGIMIGVPLVLAFFAVDRALRFAGSLLAVFLMCSIMQVGVAGHIIEAKRSFFGVHRVEQYENSNGRFRDLIHGNTLHGLENFGKLNHSPELAGVFDNFRDEPTPLTYYYPTGPIGQVFKHLGPSRRSIALVGLGIGSMAAYGRTGQQMTYYEIDPDVVTLARDSGLFDFVSSCKAQLRIKLGDARLELVKAPNASYDLIVLDAFSSDAIPMHLLTREALETYLAKLMPGGIIAYHISNRYLDLRPVLGNEAAALGLRAWMDEDDEVDNTKGKSASIWVIMARNDADFGDLLIHNAAWSEVDADRRAPVWTDDYSNLAGALKGRKATEGE